MLARDVGWWMRYKVGAETLESVPAMTHRAGGIYGPPELFR
jgi:hypothetical protein